MGEAAGLMFGGVEDSVGPTEVAGGAVGEAAGLMFGGVEDSAGPTEVAGGAVGEAAGLMAVDEAVAVAISGVDDEEAGRDCETVSGPAGGDVSGGLWVVSGSEILMDKQSAWLVTVTNVPILKRSVGQKQQ